MATFDSLLATFFNSGNTFWYYLCSNVADFFVFQVHGHLKNVASSSYLAMFTTILVPSSPLNCDGGLVRFTVQQAAAAAQTDHICV